MFSSTAKKLISSFFLTATLSSTLFFLPVASNTNTVNIAYAQEANPQTQTTTPTQTTSHVSTTAGTIKDRCTSFFSGSVSDCVLLLEYYLMVSVPRQLLLFAANVFDTLWAFGLSSETYTLGNSPDSFINAGWVVCRDIANTFFIFILLYIAIMTILQKDQKRLLSTLVTVALLINFSMYITKFVIDVGNIFALEFYSSFPVNDDPLVNIPGIQQHSIGSGFMFALESPLERIIQDIPNQSGSFAVQASLIALTGIEFLVVIFVFLLSSFYLVGRVVTLWIVMITAPIAFFSLTLPSEVSGASVWGRWKSELIDNAFFPAIFLFFIYLAAKIANGNSWILQNFATDAVGIDAFIKLGLQFAVIIAFLLFGLKKAKSMSKATSDITEKYGKMGTGFITGAALGGVAIAGRQFAGRVATNMRGTDTERALSQSKLGRIALSGINKAAEGTWDIRNTTAGKQAVSKSGGLIGTTLGGGTGFAASREKAYRENLKKYQTTYENLKGNPEAQAAYISSLHTGIQLPQGQKISYDPTMAPDSEALAMWGNLKASERQTLIDKAKPGDQEYLKSLNARLAEGYNPQTRGDRTGEDIENELKAQFESLKDKPNEQFNFFEELYKKGKTDKIPTLMKGISTKERYNIITRTTADAKAYLEQIEKERKAKLKPDQLKTENREWNGEEFNTNLKNYRESKKAAEEAKTRGDVEKEAEHNRKLVESADKVKESVKTKLEREQISALNSEDLLEEPIVNNISESQLKSIDKISGHKFTNEQEKRFEEMIRTGNTDQKVIDYLDLSRNRAVRDRAADARVHIPTGSLSNEIRLARNQ